MFTVCPKCALTLVVTAADLRVAQGYVRCGRCSSVFNALAQLTDDRSPTAAGDGEASPEEPQVEEPQSAAPAAADEESRPSPPAAAADRAPKRNAPPPAAADDESTPEYTLEFNPETTDAASLFVVAAPSPEWTAATGSFKGLATPEQQRPAPEAKAQDADEDFEVELDAALLSDIVQSELTAERPVLLTREAPAPAPSRQSAAPPATPRHTAHDRPEAPAVATRPAPVSTPAPAAASASPGTAARTPSDAAGRTPPATALKTPAPATARTPDAPAPSTPAGTPAKTPSVTPAATAATTARTPAATAGKTSLAPAAQAPPATLPASAAKTPAAAATATAAAPVAKAPPATPAKTAAAVETTASPQGDRAPDPPAPTPSGDVAFADFEAAAGATGQRAARPQWQWAAGSALLMVILFAQIINHQRDALATDPRFSQSLTAVYTALGVRLTPRWDLRAYDVRQLGATVEAGATGAITVRASIRNAGTRPQPLPLLRVTLQDRFGNRLASRDVLPSDYLPSGISPAASLAKDQRIDAELAFVDPGASAVGFELDACLPLGGGIVCANDTSAR